MNRGGWFENRCRRGCYQSAGPDGLVDYNRLLAGGKGLQSPAIDACRYLCHILRGWFCIVPGKQCCACCTVEREFRVLQIISANFGPLLFIRGIIQPLIVCQLFHPGS